MSSQAAQLETFHNSCMHHMMGRYRDIGIPSTAELLDETGQMPITQLLSRHWQGHAARKPETTMDGAIKDLNTPATAGLPPRLAEVGLDQDLWRGLPAGASLVDAY